MLVHGDSIHSKTVTGGTVGQTLKWHLSAPLEYHDEMRAAWVEATVALARKLQEARKLFASDKAFRLWLAENNLGFLSARDLQALLERDPEDNERSGLSAIPQPYAGRKAVT
jgi:hypothetical protein